MTLFSLIHDPSRTEELSISDAICMAACVSCGRTFGFNPVCVPSILINGTRQAICRDCIEIANPRRIANGLEPVEIHPEAYEPIAEEEL